MSLIEPKGLYADVAERCMYNGLLSGLSLDGKSFFYENPLEIHPYLLSRHASMQKQSPMPITQRLEVFDCSCCPPNVTRFIASAADFLYTRSDDTLFVHHYMDSSCRQDGLTITQVTDYPVSGDVACRLPCFVRDSRTPPTPAAI
jgi:DUF1680 family protein